VRAMGSVKITFYGHALFMITTSEDKKIGTDPYDEQIKDPLPDINADIVTSSHDHYDHANISLFKGNPTIINTPGETVIGNIRFFGISTFHDETGGSLRGKNIIYIIETDGIRIAHLGDLGHIPDDKQLKDLQGIDILMIPVGGVYTINAVQALDIINVLKPKVAIPMHYKSVDTKLNVDEVSSFTRRAAGFKEVGQTINIEEKSLPKKTEIWVMSSS